MNPKPKPPGVGGEFTFFSDTGPQPVRPGVPRVNLIPVGDGGPGTPGPPPYRRRRPKPLLPSAAELATLPAGAAALFRARCAARAGVPDAGETAELATAAVLALARRTGDPVALRAVRRDFARLAWLTRTRGWTDSTPVPPDAIGPLSG